MCDESDNIKNTADSHSKHSKERKVIFSIGTKIVKALKIFTGLKLKEQMF